MIANDFMLCTFEGDSATPPATFAGEILAIDTAAATFDCYLVGSGQFTFNYGNEPWAGTDVSDAKYTLASHDIYTSARTDPSSQNVAAVTFADNKRYLCYVNSIDPSIDVTFYHFPSPELSFENNSITKSNWDMYPVGASINSIEGYVLNNDLPQTEIEITPDEVDEAWVGADAPILPYNVESWRALVTEMAGDIPVAVLLRWIKHESGGNPCSTGAFKNGASIENGLFQLYSPDNDQWATPAQLHGSFCTGQTCIRNLTLQEARVQVASGIALVRNCRERATAQLMQGDVNGDEAGTDFWSLVKMQHNLPGVPKKYIPILKPSSWTEFKEGVLKEHPEYSDSNSTIFKNAEDIGSAAG
jgi:hypothetical protein